MKRFILEKNYSDFLNSMGMKTDEILRKAHLPEDLFCRKTPCLTAEEYYRFMKAIEALSENEQTPILLATAENIETFSPPIFAAFCSENAESCIKRLSQYKALVGALIYDVTENDSDISLEIKPYDENAEIPEILIGVEFVFLVNLIRKATKVNIVPKSVTTKNTMTNKAYGEFLHAEIATGNANIIVFDKTDAEIPFISRNDSMWDFFEPELARRLNMLETDDSFAARVRSVLTELIPGGRCTADDAAEKLGTSKRTLQRRLKEENTNFQQQLNHTRELLAKYYIAHTEMNTEDIAFLLGYQDINSFLRAFTLWTGQNLTEYKNSLN